MKFKVILSFIFFVACLQLKAGTFNVTIDRSGIYNALSSESEEAINNQLTLVKASNVPEKEAYEGALLMKKSGLIKGPAREKLNMFKAGRAKLETAIAKNNGNIEYRFLRLIIQEHAPKIVKYRSDIAADSQLIRANYKNQNEFLQGFMLDYSKSSTALKLP